MTKRIAIDVETYEISMDDGITLRDSCVAGTVLLGTSLTYAGHTGGWELAEEIGGTLVAEIGKLLDQQKQGPPEWRADT